MFADDAPAPYDPFAEESAAGTNTVQVAWAVYQVPAFWLACFDMANISMVESEEGDIPQLVSELDRVMFRLAKREAGVKELFPTHAATWDEFCRAVEAAGRKYLKVDGYEIWMIPNDNTEYGRLLKRALNWFSSQEQADLDALLSLAGIQAYDIKAKSFSAGDDDPERFLYGWLEA